MSDSDHDASEVGIHGVSTAELETMANTVREFFESANSLAGKSIPVEMLRAVGEQLAIADDLAGMLTREFRLSLDLFATIWKTRLLIQDTDFGGITGAELMARARADWAARN